MAVMLQEQLANSNCCEEQELTVGAELLGKSSLCLSTVLADQVVTSSSVSKRCVGSDSFTTCITVY